MRHRSRSRNYDSNDNYKSRRSPAKYESSRSHKNKTINSHYSSDSRKHESSKVKKTSDRSRYDNHRDHDSESDDKYDKKGDSNYDRDCKKSKFSKYSPAPKHSRKYDDYTHSYRRRSISSDLSNQSYDSKYKKYDDKSDSKKMYYKQNKESKPTKPSRSPSSDPPSDSKVKLDLSKEKIKDKKLKKKSKKSDKEKKKRKRQKHSSDDDYRESDAKRNPMDKSTASKSSKHNNDDDNVDNEETDSKSKSKPKLEPFKVKETSNLKSQINFLNSSNIFTKDEWQKEASDDDGHKKSESSSVSVKKIKNEPYEGESAKKPIKTEPVEETTKEQPVKKPKSDEDKDKETDDRAERARKKRHRNSRSRARDNPVRSSKHREPEDDGKSFSLKPTHEPSSRPTRSRSHNRPGDSDAASRKDKPRRSSRETHRKQTSGATAATSKGFSTDDSGSKKPQLKQTAIEDSFEDERIELPSTPTDAQYTGLFARLPEDLVSDTEVDEIVPPMLLDDRMKALLVNDPNVCQEAWDVEDDLLLSKRDSLVAPRHRGLLETLAVPWALLIDEATLHKPTGNSVVNTSSAAKTDASADESGRGLARFTVVSRLIENLGLSRQLCGDALWSYIGQVCEGTTFLHPVAPIHQTLMSHRLRRNTIFSERGLFAGALSARKDLFIRRVLYEPII